MEKSECRRASAATPRTILTLALLAALLACACYALFANLGETRIADYDEARHGVNAYEMIRNGDYLVHTYRGETDLWNLKPPLSFWSIALGYRLFGYTPFALRFFSALATLLSMLALTFFAWRRFGGAPALMLLAVFAFNQGLYGNHFARFGDADALYQFFFTLSMICMMNGRKSFRWYDVGALCFALAFLTKAAHAVNILVIYGAYLLLTGQAKRISKKRAARLALCAFLPVLVWAAARYARDGMAFFAGMLQTDVVARVQADASASEAQSSALWYYASAIIGRPALAAGLGLSALCGVYCAVRRVRLGDAVRDVVVGSLLWLMTPIVLFSLSGAQFKWYVYSGFMAVPCLTAAMLYAALREGKAPVVRLGAALTAAALAVFAWQCVTYASGVEFDHAYQECLREYLDRDGDAGVPTFIQYNEKNGDEPLTAWQPGDLLAAMLYGDVTCMDGGADAFVKSEQGGLIVMGRDGNASQVDELAGWYMQRTESGYVQMFEN